MGGHIPIRWQWDMGGTPQLRAKRRAGHTSLKVRGTSGDIPVKGKETWGVHPVWAQ